MISSKSNKLTPAFFIGHGSPMNMVSDNPYTRDLKNLGQKLEKPKAIVVISAHWLKKDTFITANDTPKMIYDFYGFPKELYEVKYDANGSPEIAKLISEYLPLKDQSMSLSWGLDHACYSVLKYIFPDADIPVLEMSIDFYKPIRYHYELGKKLRPLREKGIMFMGSGNMIHNFKYFTPEMYSKPFPWAIELDNQLKKSILEKNHERLLDFRRLDSSGKIFETPDHYYPMIYILGMQGKDEKVEFIHESIQHGSGTQRCFKIG